MTPSPSHVTLVVVSGPGREIGLERALDDMLGEHHPKGPRCCDAVVGWDTMGGKSVPEDLRARWTDKKVEWRACSWRDSLQFAESITEEDRWVVWMLDDERLCTSEYLPYRRFQEAYEWDPLGPVTPLRDLFSQTRAADPRVLLGIFADMNGLVFGEPRIWRTGFRWPSYARPLLRVLGQDTHRLVGDHEAVSGLMFRRQRFSAPEGAPVRLNIGGGSRWWSGWINIDHDATDSPDIQMDVAANKLPFKDNSVDAIVSSHMIDHLDIRQGRAFLEDCLRVLRPGAPIRLAAEDLAAFFRKYSDGSIADFAYFQPPEFSLYHSPGIQAGMVMCGALGDRSWYSGHRQLYDACGLIEMLARVGFREVVECKDDVYSLPFWDTDDIQPDHTIYVEGRK